MGDALVTVRDFLWGVPMLSILIGTGVILTLRLRFIQVRKLFRALTVVVFSSRSSGLAGKGDITPFQALTTALAATVGTGNIAGVATAIATGGPGAIFWMWVMAFFGMATKFSEVVLAVKYRVSGHEGSVSGGPMYYITNGLNMKLLAVMFAASAIVASIGSGSMVQANSVALAVTATTGLSPAITSIILMLAAGFVIIGGIKRVGKVTEKLVPLMAIFYVGGALVVLLSNPGQIPEGLTLIIHSAFQPTAAVGGFMGATIMQAMRNGVARGVFANEAGLGSSPIAHAAAKTDSPVRQGFIAMTEVFINTFIVCTMTALVIINTGAWKTGLTSSELTTEAFNQALPGTGGMIVSGGMILFAFSSILGWSYYGEKCFEFLFGSRIALLYRLIFVGSIFVGGLAAIQTVWYFADVANGFMAIPNLIALILLSGVVVRTTRDELRRKM